MLSWNTNNSTLGTKDNLWVYRVIWEWSQPLNRWLITFADMREEYIGGAGPCAVRDPAWYDPSFWKSPPYKLFQVYVYDPELRYLGGYPRSQGWFLCPSSGEEKNW